MSPRIPALQIVAALASIGAAAVHFTVAADHWSAWWGYGAQFVVAAAFQLGWGVAAMMSRSHALLGVGATLQTVFIAAWVITRTLGQPIGPAAGVAEPVGAPGVLTVLMELTTIVAAVAIITSRSGATPERTRYVAGIGTGAAAVLAATSVALLTAMTGGHHGGGGGHHGTGGHHGGTAGQHDSGGHHGPADDQRSTPATQPSESGHHRPTPSQTAPSPAPTGGHGGHGGNGHHHG